MLEAHLQGQAPGWARVDGKLGLVTWIARQQTVIRSKSGYLFRNMGSAVHVSDGTCGIPG